MEDNNGPQPSTIVHVGFHKTGSTWLQNHVFPSVQGAVYGNKNPILRELLKSISRDRIFMPATFRAALDEVGDHVLLSREDLIGSPWNTVIEPAERINRLATVVPHAKIVIVNRDRDQVQRSLYAQYVNEGGYVSKQRFVDTILNPEYLEIPERINGFKQAFHNVLVVDYHELLSDPQLFLERIGSFANVEFAAPSTFLRTNPSLTGWRLQFLRAWNRATRRSKFNSRPIVALPGARHMRGLLQRGAARKSNRSIGG